MTGKWAVVPDSNGIWMRVMRVAWFSESHAYDQWGNPYLVSTITATFDDYLAAKRHAKGMNDER